MTEECCVCLESYPDENFKKLRPCFHKMCLTCIDEFIRIGEDRCPLCRSVFGLSDRSPVNRTRHEFCNPLNVVLRLFRRNYSSTRHLTSQETMLLGQHDHSTHVRAARNMVMRPPRRRQFQVGNLDTRIIQTTSLDDLVYVLTESTNNRIYEPNRYLIYFQIDNTMG